MFNKFKRWLEGVFICQKCGGEFLLLSFGYGECLCANCYDGEKQFIFLDKSYWLNVILAFFQIRIRKKLGSKQGYIIYSTTSSAIKKQQDPSAILKRVAFFVQEFLLTNQVINIVRHFIINKKSLE